MFAVFVMRSSCAVAQGGTEYTAWYKKKALGTPDTGCLNSVVCLEILQFLMYLLAETWLS